MPEAETGGIDLRPYIAVLRRNAWLIAGVVLATVVATIVLEGLRADPAGEGDSDPPAPLEMSDPTDGPETVVQVVLQPPPTGSVDPNRPLDLFAEAQVAVSSHILGSVSEATGVTIEELRAGLRVTPGPGLSSLLISFDPSEEGSGEVAQEIAAAYLSYRERQLAQAVARLESLFAARIKSVRRALVGEDDPGLRAALIGRIVALEEERAELHLISGRRDQIITDSQINLASPMPTAPRLVAPAPTPTSMPLPRKLIAGSIIGLLLGIGLAFIKEHLQGRIWDEDEVRSVIPLVLGHVRRGDLEDDLRKVLITLDAMFRSAPYVVSVTTAAEDESSSDLAHALAGVATRIGAPSILSRSEAQAQSANGPEVTVVANPDDSRSIALSDYENLVTDMRSNRSVGIVDCGPVSAGATAASTARFVDVVVIQVTLGVTRRAHLIHAVRELELAGAARVGAVLRTAS